MASGTVGFHNRCVGFGFTVPDDDDFAVMVHDEAIRMFGRSRFDSGAGVHFQYLLVNRRRLAGDLRLHESSEPAMRLLSLAYRSAGLLWAARASCIFAIASIFIEAEEDSDLPVSVVPTLMLLGWITVELRHLPDAFEAIRLVRGCVARLPLDDASKERAAKRLQEFDLVLGSQILNFTPAELKQAGGLPDVLDRLGLHQSRTSLLYALGYEPLLRKDGSIPARETAEKVAELFRLLASQPASDNLRNPVIFNEPGPQIYVSTVLGIRVAVGHQGSEAAILAAEAE